MAKKKRTPSSKFKTAVLATPQIQNCFQAGLTALGKYSTKINLGSVCEGSVFIDECVEQKYPRDNRWDYTFGYKGESYFVEVHSANTSEVSVMLKKLQWLKLWLVNNAPELNKIKAKSNPFIWVASGKYNILKGSKQHKIILQSGLNPVSKLDLK